MAYGATVLAVLTAVGGVGFALLEGLPLADSLYLAVTTLSTVGYGDVVPVTRAGRWFAMGLIIFGVGAVFYTVVSVAEFLIEGRLRDVLGRRAVKRTIETLRDHVIVCGYGRLGRVVADKLRESRTPVVVIDPDSDLQGHAEEAGHLFLAGSASEDGLLEKAGIAHARAIVAATNSDPENVFITLSAREANPEIQVHVTAHSEAGIRRLKLAGADQVISPHQLGGLRVANAIVRPGVVEFLELSTPGVGSEIDLEEVLIPEGSGVDGVALRDLAAHGITVSVVAIKRGHEPIRFQLGPSDTLRSGDRVVVVGRRESLENLSALAAVEA